MSTKCLFNEHVDYRLSVSCAVAHEYTQTALGNQHHLDTSSFMKIPQVGEYLLSKCRKLAYRVVRHQRATACGNKLIVIFVSDPTPVQEKNSFPDSDKGIRIHVHNSKCTSHCVDIYYLTMPKGYGINAELL